MTVQDIINKRRARWEERGDLAYDRRLTEAAVSKILSDDGLRREVVERPYLLIEAVFHIVDKKKRTVPFFFNEVQREFLCEFEKRGTGKPYYVLKGRQQGFTSLITAMQLSYAIVRKNFSGMTLADNSDNALAIFNDRARSVYERLPAALRPTERFSSKREFYFDVLNSSWRVSTAAVNVGRSRTLGFVHFSEVAFYECSLAELQRGIGEAMTEDAVCIYETTANGYGEARDLWESGACHNLFFEWWRSEEYRCEDLSWIETSDPWLLSRIALLREKGLEETQISWYCRKYASYLDKGTIRREYPCSPEEAFLSGGDGVFDRERLTDALIRIPELPRDRIGSFVYRKWGEPITDRDGTLVDTVWHIDDIQFVESPGGYIRLHEAPRVRRDGEGRAVAVAPYVLGGDTAGEGTDYFTAKVVCSLDGRTAATLRVQRIDEELYAEQVYCLGKYYGDALIAIEINYSAYPTRILERKYSYPRLYYRERQDGGVRRAGFETTARTKPVIISNLVSALREDPTLERDADTLREMLTFVRLPDGGMGAAAGMHDDLVMALAIAHYVMPEGGYAWRTREERPSRGALERWFSTQSREEGNGEYMVW